MFTKERSSGWLLSLAVVAAVFSAIACSSEPMPQTWFTYEPSKVMLQGVLMLRTEYGPPNFGENPSTDKKFSIYVLHLDTPVNVKGDTSSDSDGLDADSFSDVRDIQMITDTVDPSLGKIVGKKVKVYGSLFEKITAANYTDVLIRVEKVELLAAGAIK